ncbi:zinc-dependent metalloprotease [Flavobacterium sp.]|uniref:zinc-dependent metalloprotease n=1 Tax=Flavobacterium sp. TaxID=239 RepID=UPI0028BE128A|nr:zinc-dependent metalloprotease [Flavobacterium sp.]
MKIKLLALVFISQLGFSQEKCLMEVKMNEMLSNPVMRQKYEERQARFENEFSRLQSLPLEKSAQSGPTRIPVAVHYPNAGSANASLKNCLRALAQNQINILNADYNAQNADLSTWTNTTSSYFPGVNYGSLNIQLELATQNHPAGMGLVNGDVAVTFGYDFGSGSDWDTNWAGYLNIIVRNDLGGTLGYAYLASDPADGAAIFMNNTAFGATGNGCSGYMPGAPYNLGRTLTHELGHYFNLNHIWGNGTCGNDFVADTPQHNTANGGCPAISHLSTCAGTPREMTMNYMDYTNDVCMYMFTAGQTTRQQAHFNTIVGSFNQTTLSNGEFVQKNSISVYPNPNKGSFVIQFSDYVNDFSVEVYDQSGRTVYSNKFEGNSDLEQQINLSSAATGVYFVKVLSGEESFVRKMLVD